MVCGTGLKVIYQLEQRGFSLPSYNAQSTAAPCAEPKGLSDRWAGAILSQNICMAGLQEIQGPGHSTTLAMPWWAQVKLVLLKGDTYCLWLGGGLCAYAADLLDCAASSL